MNNCKLFRKDKIMLDFIKLLFNEDLVINPKGPKSVHSTMTIEGRTVEVCGFLSPPGVIKIRLSWSVEGTPYTDESLSFLRYEKKDKAMGQLAAHAIRVIRMSVNQGKRR